MAKTETIVRDDKGNATHIDVTTDDGKTTYRYNYDGSVVGSIIFGNKGSVDEVFTHKDDGTTTSRKR